MNAHDPFAGPALAARLPLTEAQREVWLGAEIHPEANLAYNEPGSLSFSGPLDVAALLGSLQTLVDRHEVLHASFSPDGQWLCVCESLTLDIPVIDISADPERLLLEHEKAIVSQPFDLASAPLIRYRLLRASATEHTLLRCAHHAIVDGWSSWVLSNELGQLYSAAVEGRDASLPPAARYGDYAQIERDFVASEEGRSHLDYWLKVLDNPPNQQPLPNDLPRPAERSYTAARLDMDIDPALVGQLRKLGAAQSASLVATTLAAFSALLYRLSGQDDLIVGLAAAGQSFHSQKNLVGHAVNLLPLRLRPSGDMSFTQLLSDTRASVLDAFDHQGVSFGSIVPTLQFERDRSRPPLVPIVFNIDVRSGDVCFAGLNTRLRNVARPAEIYELFINMVDDGKSLVLEASYNAQLYSRDAMQARLSEYTEILRSVVANPAQTLAELPLLAAAEYQRIVKGFNARRRPVPAQSLDALILTQASRNPQAIAVRFGETQLSYAGLDAESATLARALLAAGVTPGSFVAVNLERQLLLPAALLAVLRCGAAYVSLDPELPRERIASILEQCQPVCVLTQDSLLQLLPSGTPSLTLAAAAAVSANDPLPATVDPELPAYVIFTSGSTGKPKGVVVSHANVVNCLTDLADAPGLKAGEVVLAVAAITFDFSVYEIFLPLLVGATLVVADRDTTLDGARLSAAIAKYGVTSLHATPATFRLLLADHWAGAPNFRAVFGGEALPRDLIQALAPKVREIWNIYGPTEVTITSNLCRVRGDEDPIPVGPPVANTQSYVLDARGTPLPVGVVGELYVGGAGVTLGYLGQPQLTAERYVPDPFTGGNARLYRTGDLARWRPDGVIECLGRADFQVKLRGFRIELGEIESALNSHPAVAESLAAVKQRSADDPRLVAFFTLREGAEEPTVSALRALLRTTLPGYMVPQQFQRLDALPRLANGKLDRKSLPDPFASANAAAAAREPARGLAEQALAAIWAEVLGLPDISSIGREDRFFDLGGHSLLAVQAAAKIQLQSGIKPPLRSLLMDPLSVIAAAHAELGGKAMPAMPRAVASAPVQRQLPTLSPDLLKDVRIPTRPPIEKPSGWLGKLLGK